MTVVVSDTSPINYLILIDAIFVLPELFTSVVIPKAVSEELQHAQTPEPVKEWLHDLPEWAQIAEAAAVDNTLKLDAGEKEALALAQELGGVPILMDERKGRVVAKSFGLITTGTLNILEEAAVKNLIDIEEALRKLNETSFYLSAELIYRFKKQVTERKS